MGRYDGVDVDGVIAQLNLFLEATFPVAVDGSPNPRPTGGWDYAVESWERVRPFFDALYPEWLEETTPDEQFELGAKREACLRLRGRLQSAANVDRFLGPRFSGP